MPKWSKFLHPLKPRSARNNDIRKQVDARLSEESTKEEIEEQVLEVGEAVVMKTLDAHYETVQKAHHKYSLSNEQLLSTNLQFSSELPRRVRKQVTALRETLRQNMQNVAEAIEHQSFQAVDEAIRDFHFSPFEQQRVNDILGAQKDIHVSYQSIRLSIQLFKRINKQLLHQIEHAKTGHDRGKETDLLLKNAILVYELAHAIVVLLEDFALHGIETLESIHTQMLEEIEKNRQADEELLERCNQQDLSPGVVHQTLRTVENRDKLRQIVRMEWDDFIGKLDIVKENVALVKRQIPNLEMIRDNAKNQLGFLQIVAITQMMKDNLEAAQGLLSIDDIPLAPVTPEDLCRLLGINLGSPLEQDDSQDAPPTPSPSQTPEHAEKIVKTCPHCSKPYQIRAEFLGKTVTCKRCRQKFTV